MWVYSYMNKQTYYKNTEKIGKHLSISQDVCSNCCLVTITGNMQVLVENYKGLIEYNSECIVLQAVRNQITVKGNQLSIQTYNNEDCMICGKIDAVLLNESSEV